MLLALIGAKRGKSRFSTKSVRDALLRLRKMVANGDEPNMDAWTAFYYHSTGEAPKTAQDILAKALERIDSALEGIDSREATLTQHGDVVFVETGGMSWGDSPTQLFDDICDIQEMPEKLLKKAGILF